jgi:hypothetical protein
VLPALVIAPPPLSPSRPSFPSGTRFAKSSPIG